MPENKMPGWEPVPEVPVAVQADSNAYNGGAAGCQCADCKRARMASAYGAAVESVGLSPPSFNWEGSSTGRISGRGPAPNLPVQTASLGDQFDPTARSGFDAANTPSVLGWVEGRYDFTNSRDARILLNGQLRWRVPGTLEVADEQGRRQWTFTQELPDGTLVDDRGRKWVPNQADVVRGRYTSDSDANLSMSGEVRWLQRSTGTLYEDAACQHRANSSMQPLPDGTWRSAAGMVWEPL